MTGPFDRPSRRTLLKGAAGAAFALGMPFVRRARASERSLKVSSFGGVFQRSFAEDIFPAFAAATGIKAEPVARGEGADLVTVSQDDVIRGAGSGFWRTFDANRIPNLELLDRRFVHRSDGRVDAIGSVAWYQTLVVNPKSFGVVPDSWKVLWEPGRQGEWGLSSGSRSTLFEITAATWFGGNAVLESEAGIAQVVAKIDELKPNVRLWWDSEASMQTAYEDGHVVGGMYYNDMANQMAEGGTEIRSIFPREGGVIDFGSWCQPAASSRTEEAQEFVNFMCAPSTQALLTRKVGTAPLVDRRLTDLSEAEFALVSSDRKPIAVAVEARMRSLDFMRREFAKMLTS